ncbi:HlyD family type I secretion periplasmic adaptor subunit [Thalassotalea sp. G20_0]|uniref:HlyD family type I secretion periplasmic adaptor subunit n=1 Tax=Thalassotalea sp. G20_0 TaxID=2821093 RepID=UPI001ADC2A6A|nr:HlyD family type I secretion periplasmic adaptor subunit [Thalassotalea sp. G20_0]MBO9496101.1 HlyD family type I secretion periplasmic adaptor subunit [Thalassotalea sp. G20_0]
MSSSDDKDVKGSTEAPVNQTEPSEGHITKPAESEQLMPSLAFSVADGEEQNASEDGKREDSLENSLEASSETSSENSSESAESEQAFNVADGQEQSASEDGKGEDSLENSSETSSENALEKIEDTVLPDDMEYISDTNVAMLIRTPKGGRLLIYTMLLALFSSIVWASVARLDEITRGLGIVIPSSRLQVVQNLEGGILEQIFVAEGQQVHSGQPLMQLDDTRFSSTFRESAIEYYSELAKAARLRAELSGETLNFPAELDDYPAYMEREREIFYQRADRFIAELNVAREQAVQAEHELATTEDQLIFLTTSFELGQDELELTVPLAEQGVVSRVELIQLRQRVNDLESQMRRTELSIPKLQAAHQEALSRKEEVVQEYRADIVQELKETEVHLDQLGESNHALEDQVDRTLIKSPMDGIVKKIHVTTLGGVVQPGMSLLEIVPLEDNLMIEAQIQPKDIGFLRLGMKAVVKLTAYDFAIYGGLEGEVEHISADTIKDEQGESFYIVRIRTKNNFVGSEDKPLMIIPGMRTNVDIITGDKTLMAYLLKPILRAKQNALTER